MQQFLLSLEVSRQRETLVCTVFDLGLQPEQRRQLFRRFPWIDLRPAAFSHDPPHVAQLANFAWKPTLLTRMAQECNSPLLWLDSACVILDSLEPIWRHLQQEGCWSPYGGGSRMDARTHPGMLAQLQATPAEAAERFRSACCCAFDPSQPAALALLYRWRDLAWDPALLSPSGSCAANHRYDQSLLTVLLARSSLFPSHDELDVSGLNPIPYLRTRNKVTNAVPLWLDPLCRAWFWTYRWIDVRILRWKAGLYKPSQRLNSESLGASAAAGRTGPA
jgi:hypothetical protein